MRSFCNGSFAAILVLDVRVIVYLPLLLSALLAVVGPWSAVRMPPKLATRLLLASGLTCAVTSLVTLGLLAATLLGQLPMVATVGAWSAGVLHRDDPVSPVIAGFAAAALVVVGAVTVRTAARWVLALRGARRASRAIQVAGRLVVLDQPVLEAFALPAGRHSEGRIIVSSSLLRLLDAAERRVLLTHEAAHLRHRHYRHRLLADLIAATNPLLVGLPGAIHHLTERWADEEAAAVAGRRVAARTLARVAVAGRSADRRSPFGGAVQCFHRHGVPRRVRALLEDRPPRRPLAALLFAMFIAFGVLSASEAVHDAAQLFDRASDHCDACSVGLVAAVGSDLVK
jgi:Zn-dependent protease with chaperone function